MKAILLAAGRGTRIARNVEMVPKSTLPIDGEPLIRRSVALLQIAGMQCIVSNGYKEEKVKEELDKLIIIGNESGMLRTSTVKQLLNDLNKKTEAQKQQEIIWLLNNNFGKHIIVKLLNVSYEEVEILNLMYCKKKKYL